MNVITSTLVFESKVLFWISNKIADLQTEPYNRSGLLFFDLLSLHTTRHPLHFNSFSTSLFVSIFRILPYLKDRKVSVNNRCSVDGPFYYHCSSTSLVGLASILSLQYFFIVAVACCLSIVCILFLLFLSFFTVLFAVSNSPRTFKFPAVRTAFVSLLVAFVDFCFCCCCCCCCLLLP